MGGGYQGPTAGNQIVYNGPVGGSPATGWQVTADGTTPVTAYVVCAP
ncbi:hypothetical protein [Streptomyces yanii]|uniref:Uncharacterized protein n=1 Tax=Streptomyces yanii TaxID=78510 RepID=A0ABV5RED7_9ACTN